MTTPTTPEPTGPQLLRWHIDASRLTIRGYASGILRSERTVSRWLDAETAMPRRVLLYLLGEWERAGKPPITDD